MKNATIEAAIIGTRRSFDGATINLHADGSLSTVLYFLRGGKLPVASMWRHLDDVCLYAVAELPDFIRAANKAKPARKPRPTAEESERIMAVNSRQRFDANQVKLIYRTAIEWR